MAYKNRSQGMKCKRVKDPILKRITNGTKMRVMIQIKNYGGNK